MVGNTYEHGYAAGVAAGRRQAIELIMIGGLVAAVLILAFAVFLLRENLPPMLVP